MWIHIKWPIGPISSPNYQGMIESTMEKNALKFLNLTKSTFTTKNISLFSSWKRPFRSFVFGMTVRLFKSQIKLRGILYPHKKILP